MKRRGRSLSKQLHNSFNRTLPKSISGSSKPCNMENEITGDSLFFTTSYRIMGACRTRRLFFLELGQLGLGISKIPTIVTLKLSKEPLLVLFFGLSWRDQRKAKRSALLLLVKLYTSLMENQKHSFVSPTQGTVVVLFRHLQIRTS